MKKRIYTGQEASLAFNEIAFTPPHYSIEGNRVLTFNDKILTFYIKGITHYDVSNLTFNEKDMGESTIQVELLVDPGVVSEKISDGESQPYNIEAPVFSKDWYIDFRGEKFYLSTLNPACIKDTSSQKYRYSLTFNSQRADLDRYEFANFVAVDSIQFPISYDFSLALTVQDFVERFNINLNHYLGSGVWAMELDSSYMDNLDTAIYDGLSLVTTSFSRETLWSLLTGVFDIFGLRWRIRNIAGVMTIQLGYTPEVLEHIFEYGKDRGLVSIERVNPNKKVYTRLSGIGSKRNLPYRYFKDVTSQFPEDPDYNQYTISTPYAGLMPTSYREYVKGWNDATYFNVVSAESYAYLKGYNDASSGGVFNPVDYVISQSTEAVYGVRKGSVETNEDIYPTLQGVTDPSLGRLDEIVGVEQVLNDEYKLTEADNAQSVATDKYLQKYTDTSGFSVVSDTFQITETYNRLSFFVSVDSSISSPATRSFEYTVSLKLDGSVVDSSTFNASAGTYNIVNEYIFDDLQAGEYTISVTGTYQLQNSTRMSVYTVGVSEILARKPRTYKQTFDVWIKNVWGTTFQDAENQDETEDEYMHRVWDPLVSASGDMTIMFSTGLLAGSDYAFKVAKPANSTKDYYIYHDTTKQDSHWRLSLIKSDANIDSTSLMLPNMTINASVGDYFFFTNIEMPYYPYVYEAENKLEAFLNNELFKESNEGTTFAIKPSPVFLETYSENASIGCGVGVVVSDEKIGWALLYITSLSITYREGSVLPDWEITVSDKPASSKNSVQILQGNVKVLSNTLSSAKDIVEQVQLALDSRYLRRDGQPQESLSKTNFRDIVTTSGILKSDDYIQGQIGGSGYSVFKDTNGSYILEIDRINVRKELNVNSLVINQISAMGGKYIYSAAAMEVVRVDSSDASYDVCYLDVKNGTVVNQFVSGDHAYCQRFDPQTNLELKYFWREVVGVGADHIKISKIGGDGTGVPAVGDIIAQLGNNTNEARQSCLIIDQTNGGSITQYAQINGYSLTNKDFVSFGVNPLTGLAYNRTYGDWYVGGRNPQTQNYINFDSSSGLITYRGKIAQDSTVVDEYGNSSSITVDRGDFDPSVAYFSGNTVYHLGSTYKCTSNAPIGTHPTNASYWSIIASKGADGTSAKIIGSVDASVNLPYPYDGSIGDGYIVENTGYLWVYNGASWIPAGQIKGDTGPQGPQGQATYTWVGYGTDEFGSGRLFYGSKVQILQQPLPMESSAFIMIGGTSTYDYPSNLFGETDPVVIAYILSQLAFDGYTLHYTEGNDYFVITKTDGTTAIDEDFRFTCIDDYNTTLAVSQKFGPSDSSDGMKLVGFAANKTSAVKSKLYNEYDWSLYRGANGADGNPGANGESAITLSVSSYNASVDSSTNNFTLPITVKLLSGSNPISTNAYPVVKTLTGLSAAANTKHSYDYVINLTGFSNSTTTIGYMDISVTYGGKTYSASISVARVVHPVMPIKGAFIAGQTYTGNCFQRDVVTYAGGWYALLMTVGTASSVWVASEWEQLQSFKNIATDTLLAENANIAGFIYKDEKMVSQSGTVDGGPSTNWAHPGFTPNLTLDGSTGQIIANNAIIKGTADISSGSIGGVNIGSDHIGEFSDPTDPDFGSLTLTREYIRQGDASLGVKFGNLTPYIGSGGYSLAGSIKNIKPGAIAGYGLNIDVSSGSHMDCGLDVNLSTEDPAVAKVGVRTNGGLISSSIATGYGVEMVTISNNSPHNLDYRKAGTALVKMNYKNGAVCLPSKSIIHAALGILASPYTPFCIEYSVICHGDSTTDGLIFGRTTLISGHNTAEYPYFRDGDYNHLNSGRGMFRGDTHTFYMVYDGTVFDAYLKCRNNQL